MQTQNVLEMAKILFARRRDLSTVTLKDLIEEVPNEELPWLDRSDVNESRLNERQRKWYCDGHVVLPKLIPDHLIDAYCKVYIKKGPWKSPTPYMFIDEIKDLCLYKPLMDEMEQIIGNPVAMHLNLTGWTSTERNWHQDDYLNPTYINGHYLAAWIALEDIHPDCGVFQYIPGSHRIGLVRGYKVRSCLPRRAAFKDTWPKDSEKILTRLFEEESEHAGHRLESYLPKKGDVLLWHARLLHRGSVPIDRTKQRRAIITHYTAIGWRREMPVVRQHKDQGHYYVIREGREH